MSLSTGTRLGPYEIQSPIGAGGMGEVYRARDTRLKRDVALKILPESFASDPERLARFQREAEVLASLNHPNIAQIYGFEKADGLRALVMELVEGPTLADRIAQGPIPVDEALPIARQIAEALEAAHEQGIIHRDLKPANVKVRADGTVKVLDFGLAKALEPMSAAGVDATASPTITSPAVMTGVGMLLGTAAYMSPEQARGKAVDKRTDIWAFGCVLFEMLTGRRAFQGEDVTDTIVAVLSREPNFDKLPSSTPGALRRVLRRCLAKDRRQRLSDAAAVRLEVEEAQTTPAADAETMPAHHVSGWRRTATFVLAVGLIAGVGVTVWLTTRAALPRVTRTMIVPPRTTPLLLDEFTRDVAIAPDGRRIAYVSANGTLALRPLDQLAPSILRDLGQPRHPAFSPDGQWIAFFDGSTSAILKKVAAAGGAAITLAPRGAPARGVSWGDNDAIVFATADPSTGLLLVSATGGGIQVLTRPDRTAGEVDHLWPEMLPGGEAVIFTVTTSGGIAQARVELLDLRTGERRVLVRGGSHAQYLAPGYLVYGAAATLWAVAFDRRGMQTIGMPVPVVENVGMSPSGATNASVGGDGTLIYVPEESGGAAQRTLVWVDRQGREEALGAPPRSYAFPRISPTGAQVAVSATDQDQDLWIWDLARRTLTRATFDSGVDLFSIWTPDSRRLVWGSQRESPGNLYSRAASGTGTVERLTDNPRFQAPTSVTPDGTRVVLFEDGRPDTGTDLMVLALDGPGKSSPTPLVATPFAERNGEISRDGRWIAYESDESGQFEIYVRSFPAVEEAKWQVSAGGGRQPLWAPNGRELFYRRADGAVMGVVVNVEGLSLSPGTPNKVVVEARYFSGTGGTLGRTYDVAPDGRRFLMIKEGSTDAATATASIVVVQNWHEELKRLVPTN